MHYRTETFALYDVLFTEAYQTLVKEAQGGVARKMPGFFRRLWRGARGTAEKELGAAQHQTGQVSEALLAQQAELEAAQVAQRQAQRVATEAAAKQQAAEQGAKQLHETATREMSQYGANPGALTSAQRMRNLGLAGTAVGAAGIPAAYYAGQSGAEQKGRTSRNLAFGAGAAAGLAAPQLVTGLGAIANSAGQTGLFPELQGAGFDPNAPQGNY